jgi:hypothetical protein
MNNFYLPRKILYMIHLFSSCFPKKTAPTPQQRHAVQSPIQQMQNYDNSHARSSFTNNTLASNPPQASSSSSTYASKPEVSTQKPIVSKTESTPRQDSFSDLKLMAEEQERIRQYGYAGCMCNGSTPIFHTQKIQ